MRQFSRHARLLVLALALGGVCHTEVMAQQASGSEAAKKSKVVFQVSDGESKKWELTLSNVKNVIKDMGKDNIDVEIVAYGPGIEMFKFESPVASRIDEIIKMGAHVMICENTMQAQKISKADMLNNLGYVQAGVSQLIKRQQQGYAYIRP